MAVFRITMSAEPDAFQVSMVQGGEEFSVDFGSMEGRPVTPYPGPYTVTPAVEAQSLATAEKYMDEDVTVLEIPYYETSNVYGSTVHIAPTS